MTQTTQEAKEIVEQRCIAMRQEVKSCIADSLQELKYRILFPSGDIVTRTILNAIPQSWIDALDWLTQPDRVTDALYPQYYMDDLRVYLYADNVKKPTATTRIGPLGDQFSKYHYETTREHALQVVNNLNWRYGKGSINLALGILHDLGKKYTAATNQRGYLCFYGHAALSAYIAGLWLWRKPALLPDSKDDDLWSIIAAIYLHMTYRSSLDRQEARNDMIKQLQLFFADNREQALLSIAMVDMLDQSDVGCTTENELQDLQLAIPLVETWVATI